MRQATAISACTVSSLHGLIAIAMWRCIQHFFRLSHQALCVDQSCTQPHFAAIRWTYCCGNTTISSKYNEKLIVKRGKIKCLKSGTRPRMHEDKITLELLHPPRRLCFHQCRFVCSFVSRIMKKLKNYSNNFHMGHGRNHRFWWQSGSHYVSAMVGLELWLGGVLVLPYSA